MNTADAKRVLETALICSQQPLQSRDMRVLFDDVLELDVIEAMLQEIQQDWALRGVELVKVATGWRFQSRPEMRAFLDRLHPEKPPRYTRATLETLAIIAYRQPVTRAEVEHLRGVDCGGVLKTLLEKHLVRILGKKDIPGRPLIYGTSKEFLEIFGLKDLKSLPTLREIQALDEQPSYERQEELQLEPEKSLPVESQLSL